MSGLNKYEEKMAKDEGKEGTEGQRGVVEKKDMRINREINHAATPSGEQSARKDSPESIWTHANTEAFSAN